MKERQYVYCEILYYKFEYINMLRKSREKIGGVAINKNVRTPARGNQRSFLLEFQTKIERKLTSLKAVINQKKQQEKRKVSARQKTVIQPIVVEKDPQIGKFLSKIGMHVYADKISQNGIDSFQIFQCIQDIIQEIKQKELEEIGIPKGHALKIAVNLKKQIHQRESNMKKVHTPNTNATTRKQPHGKGQKKEIQILSQKVIKENPQSQADSSQCQQSFPLNRKYFCLFCYARSEHQFCSQRCQQAYDRMFSKYQQNLANAQKMFLKNKQPQAQLQLQQEDEEEEGNSQNSFLCFMNDSKLYQQISKQEDHMNQEQYEDARNDLLKLKFDDNQ